MEAGALGAATAESRFVIKSFGAVGARMLAAAPPCLTYDTVSPARLPADGVV